MMKKSNGLPLLIVAAMSLALHSGSVHASKTHGHLGHPLNSVTELVIVDHAVPQQHLFTQGLEQKTAVAFIHPDSDGQGQLESILSSYRDLEAVHLVSHGSDGIIYLGRSEVSEATLDGQTLSAFDQAMKPNADLLIYGCNIAQTLKGQQLLHKLAQANVDVAASSNLTGYHEKGGDWNLEVNIGDINSQHPTLTLLESQFFDVLNTVPLSGFSGSGTNSLSTSDFTITGYSDDSQYSLEIEGNAYINSNNQNKESYFKVEANNVGPYASFSLSDVNLADFRTVDISDIYIIGQTTSGGTITSPALTAPNVNQQDSFNFNSATELTDPKWGDLTGFEIYFTPFSGDTTSGFEFINFTVGPAVPVDNAAPIITSVTIPDSVHKVGDTVTATITVTSDIDNYASGGSISGTINGYVLGSLSKINGTTYTATFTVTDGGTDVAAVSNVAVNFTLTDSSGNTSTTYTTAINQGSDTIYANLPMVSLITSSNSLSEDGGSATLIATLSESLNNHWPETVTVNLAYTGTATAVTDYTKSDSITIATGSTSNTATVTSKADILYDSAIDETIIVDISSLSAGTEDTTNQQTLTITDAELAPTVTLSGSNININENGGISAITATLSHATYEDVTVNLSYSGSATYGSDYQNASSSITILAGNLNGSAVNSIQSIDDVAVETDETIIIDIASVSGGGATESGTQQRTITIWDDEDSTPPTITGVSIPNLAHKVGDTVTATITVTSDSDNYTNGSGAISGTINGYNLIGLSRVDNTTYRATFTISDGGIDTDASSDVAVNVTLTDSSGNTSSAYTSAISQGRDAIYANLPEVELTTSSNSMSEDGGSATLTATLSGSLNSQWPVAITVGLAYTGTATADTDYTKADSIIVASGDSSNTATVTSTPDTLYDAAIDETIIVDISSLTVGTEGTTNQQTITITDAETAPTVSLSVSDNSIDENAGTSSITATLSHVTYADTIVNLGYGGSATSGTDYDTPSSNITIPQGQLTTTAVTGITAVDDSDGDGDITVVIDITGVSGGSVTENGTQQETITIYDDEDTTAPTFDIFPVLSSVSASGASLSIDLNEEGTVYYIVVESAATAPSAIQVKQGTTYNDVTLYAKGNLSTSGTVKFGSITGLSDGVNYAVYLVAEDNANNLQTSVIKLDLITTDILPNITSITLASSPAETASSITFNVLFSDDVANVTDSDFMVTLVGGKYNQIPTITHVSGAGANYVVTVNTGVTIGDVRLDLKNSSGIVDESNNMPLGFTAGDVHSVDTNIVPNISESTGNVGDFTFDEDVKSDIDLSDAVVTDGNDDLLTVTMSVNKGLLFAKDGNITISNTTISGSTSSGSASITLTGLAVDITNFLNATDRIAFQTAENDTSSVTFTMTVNDNLEMGSGLSEIISINSVNDAPVAVIDEYDMNEGGLLSGESLLDNDTDVENDSLTAVKITEPIYGDLVLNDNGTFTYQHDGSETTSDSFTYKVNDGAVDSNTVAVTITINAQNDAPVISGSPATTVAEGNVYSFTPTVTDSDVGDTKTFSMSNKPSWLTLNASTGLLTGTPANGDVGDTASMEITVTDSGGLTDKLAAFKITVTNTNEAPVISGTPATTVAEGEVYSFTPTVADSDVGDTKTFSMTNKPSWLTLNASTGLLTGTPANGDVGDTASMEVTVTDSGGLTDKLAAFKITVTNTNEAPVISGTPATTVAEGEIYSFTPTVTDSDVDDTKTFTITNKPNWLTFNASTGFLTGTPANGDVGDTASMEITVTDSGGLTDKLAAFKITVTNTNEAPVISGTPATTVAEGAVYSFTPTVTDSDVDDTKTFTITNKPSWASFSSSTGSLTGTPDNDDVGETVGIIITVKDSEEASASLPAFTLTVTNENDAPEAVDDEFTVTASADDRYVLSVLNNDIDIDGDALIIEGAEADLGQASIISNELVYQADEDFVGTVMLNYSINDGNDMRDSAVVTLNIEDDNEQLGPVITLPDDVFVNATGLYTKVDLGVAIAKDQDDNPIAVSLVDNNLLFAPGMHSVYWQATDQAGNRSVAQQRVSVAPLISLSKDDVIFEGNTTHIKVMLNGPSPSYPLTIPYQISGTADSGDHSVIDDELILTQGVEINIVIETLVDGFNEGDETVVVTLNDGLNKGSKHSTTITISEENITPELSLSVEQANEERLTVSQADGVVTVTATASDGNVDDTLSLNWISSTLSDSDNDEYTFSFNPANYASDIHQLTVTVTDNGTPSLSLKKQVYLDIRAALSDLTNERDSDGDTIPDANEGYGDDDGDGIPNYLDTIKLASCNVIPETLDTQTQFLVEGDPGVCLRKGNVSVNSENGGLLVGNEEISDVDNEALIVGGIFDYIAYGLPEAGQTYNVVFPQLLPIPKNAVYRKYKNNAWHDFVIDTNNKVFSSTGEQGYCPPPGHISWVEGLQENAWCVQLQIKDGGPNDDDGLENGTIVDPGGVAVLLTANTFPEANDDAAAMTQNSSITVAVLDNDSDADNDILSVTNISVAFGSAVIDGDEMISYTAPLDYVGQDTVTYTINDNNGGTDVAILTVTINPPDAGVVKNESKGGGSFSWVFILGLQLVWFMRKHARYLFSVIFTAMAFNVQAVEGDTNVNQLEENVEMTVTLDKHDNVSEQFTNRKWRLSAEGGYSRQHGSSNLSGIPSGDIVSIDKESSSWGLQMSYDFNSTMSLFIGYLDLGEGSTTLQNNAANYHQTVAQVTPVFGEGITTGATYQFWYNQGFSSRVLGGAFIWQSELDSTFEGTTIEHDKDGVDPFIGISIAYQIADNVQLEMTLRRFYLDDNDIDNVSAGIAYRF